MGRPASPKKAPVGPPPDQAEPTPRTLRILANTLRSHCTISPQERKHRGWFDALRDWRREVLEAGRWLERNRPWLLDEARTLRHELADERRNRWSRYDASTWLDIARDLEGIVDRWDDDPDYFVDKDQACVIAGVAKSTFEHAVGDGRLPEADRPGGKGKGKKSLWAWSKLRPPLQDLSGRTLPWRFPAKTW